jgi:hypothetical protein
LPEYNYQVPNFDALPTPPQGPISDAVAAAPPDFDQEEIDRAIALSLQDMQI